MASVSTWMPLYPADILSSCIEMSPAQFGGYMRLLCYAWQSGGVPNDYEACSRIAGGMTATDWAGVRKRLVVLDEGTSQERLSHPRLEAEREKAETCRARKAEAIAKARAAKASSVDSPVNNPVNSLVDNPVNSSPSPSPPPSPSPSPVFKNESPTEILGATRQKPRRTYRVTWDSEKGFQGVTDEDISRWKAAYPGVDLTLETARAHSWVCDNPSKAGKRNWAAFLSRWFSRVQDKGGSVGAPKPAQKTFRPDAGQAMTASEYADWKAVQQREEYLRAKARKRGGGMQSLGEIIHDRTE